MCVTEMNLQLHHVVADITGATGLRIIRAILAGERDPEALAGLRHYSCHSSAETIAKALTGSYRTEHLLRSSRHSPCTTLTTRRHLPRRTDRKRVERTHHP